MPYGVEQPPLPHILDEVEIVGWEEDEEVIPFQYSITSYGADYPVESLVKRMGNGDIFIPHFQREYVWNVRDASRFVESLLLGLPVPGIFLSREYDTHKLLVIDGQQRLRTLQFFYNGVFEPTGEKFALIGVQPNFVGANYKSLREEDRRRLDDSIIHLTIIQQDEPSDDDSSIYHIFERLNTTGRPLSNQEIRACLFHGEFNKIISELNKNHEWRTLFGGVDRRMRDQELILRFFALYFHSDIYQKPMKGFLNRYMKRNRHLEMESEKMLKRSFIPTVQAIHSGIGNKAFKPRNALNAAVFDAVMVGVARRLQESPIVNDADLGKAYQELIDDKDFEATIQTATSDEKVIRTRIRLATKRFADVK